MKPLVLALFTACLALALAACGGGGGAQSAGPVPSVPPETEPAAPAATTAGNTQPTERVGFIGLPPEGATPSSPESGQAVLYYEGPIQGDWGLSWFWLYADGRLISWREADLPEGANGLYTGYLEQRLPRSAVEQLRSEVVAAAEGGYTGTDYLSLPFYTALIVRDGDRLVRVEETGGLGNLPVRLTDPKSWLPASAWEALEIRPYVPSKYTVCYEEFDPDPFNPDPDQPIVDADTILAFLPAAAGDLLRAKATREQWGSTCSDVTSEEARTIAEALNEVGLKPGELQFLSDYMAQSEDSRLAYVFSVPRDSDPFEVGLYFEPILPHGGPGAVGCCGYDPSLLREMS